MDTETTSDLLKNLKVLYVEDETTIRESLASILHRRVGELYTAENGAEGFELFMEKRPDVVITDIRMPVLDGIGMARKIRERSSRVPIIITTGHSDEEYLLSAIDVGVDKYIKKPVDFQDLERALGAVALNIIQEKTLDQKNQYISGLLDIYPGFMMIIDRNGKVHFLNRSFLDFMGCKNIADFHARYKTIEPFLGSKDLAFYKDKSYEQWVHDMSLHPELDYVVHLRGNDDKTDEDAGAFLVRMKAVPNSDQYLVNFTDITLIEIIRLLYHDLATKDPLTKIFNRKKFYEDLDEEIERARRYKHIVSLIMFDIDHFKKVNDDYGHQEGDRILVDIVGIIRQTIRKNDVFARYGGEEFILFLPETELEGSILIAERLRDSIAKHDFDLERPVTCSFGVTTFEGENDVDSFVKKVDEALYIAKRKGRNRVEIFTRTNEN